MKKFFGLLLVVALLLAWGVGVPREPGPTPVLAPTQQLGFNYSAWWSGRYGTPEADRSLEQLAGTGAGWVAPIVTAYVSDIAATTLDYTGPRTPTDSELQKVFATSHELGLKVFLKPHLDLIKKEKKGDDWRGMIGMRFESNEDWTRWFSAYGEMILHYADLAEASGVEQFCVGVELENTVEREGEWRDLIEKAREVYSGSVVYCANHTEPWRVLWWDAVDFIGVDAYYPLTESASPTQSEIASAWGVQAEFLEKLSTQWDRKVLLTEIGYRSVDGALREPWSDFLETEVDLAEQELGYQVLHDTVRDATWCEGVFLWAWSHDPDEGGEEDRGFTPRGKPAEAIVREWFLEGR